MVIVRTGLYGSYYGTTFSQSGALSGDQYKVNAYYNHKEGL